MTSRLICGSKGETKISLSWGKKSLAAHRLANQKPFVPSIEQAPTDCQGILVTTIRIE